MQNINKNKILKMYFEKHLKRADISKKLKLSDSYITRIIKQDSRYENEKIHRKEVSKKKQAERTVDYINKTRQQKANEQIDDFLQIQHNQAASELSNHRGMSNRAIRQWCAGAYNYNSKKSGFEFDKNIGRSYAMPKLIRY